MSGDLRAAVTAHDATWALHTPSLWESPDERSIPALLAAIGQVLVLQSADHPEPKRDDVDSLARLLMATWERVEGAPVGVSYVATFADMARDVLRAGYADHPEPDEADGLEAVLVAHQPGSDWHCTCGEDLFGGSAAYGLALYRAHVAAAIRDAFEVRRRA